jgi:hypothetical protein
MGVVDPDAAHNPDVAEAVVQRTAIAHLVQSGAQRCSP